MEGFLFSANRVSIYHVAGNKSQKLPLNGKLGEMLRFLVQVLKSLERYVEMDLVGQITNTRLACSHL